MALLNGVDSNILVFAPDPDTEEHKEAMNTFNSTSELAVNPTVIHETYHTLAKRSQQKLDPEIFDSRNFFFNTSRSQEDLSNYNSLY
jgi:predicted nucleic acid-binding protein